MDSLRYVGASLREFGSRWVSYLLLVGIVSGAVDFVVIPILRSLAVLLLSAENLPYLSYDNFGFAFQHCRLTLAGLFGLALVVLVLVYLQFAVLLGGVENLRTRSSASFRSVLKRSFSVSRIFHVRSFGFFLLYFLLIVPFSGLIVGSRLLAKLTIPTFILEFLEARPVFAVLVVAFYIGVAYLGMRWIRVLPNVILKDMPFSRAARESWRETRGRFWLYLWRMAWLFVVTTVILYVWMWSLIGVQTWFDDHSSVAFGAAIVTMAVLIGGKLLMAGMSTILYLLFLVAPYDVAAGRSYDADESGYSQVTSQDSSAQFSGALAFRTPRRPWRNRHSKAFKWLVGITATLTIGFTCIFSGVYMGGEFDYDPLTISHRGVDAGNGVQNTIPALMATAKKHPDFVEMDIHETKDEQFVVMHDENLKALTGVDAAPHDLALSELQKLTARENGKSANLASFDDYLAASEQLHQKLVVEIKTTPADSSQMLEHFIDRYGSRLIENGYYVQSLDYAVISGIVAKQPKLFVSFIMPYSLVFPHTPANAYTAEVTTLNDSFVDRAQSHGQQVWAWTINDSDEMEEVMFMGVDGIVTDNLSTLKQALTQQKNHPSYAKRLQAFATIIGASGTEEAIEN